MYLKTFILKKPRPNQSRYDWQGRGLSWYHLAYFLFLNLYGFFRRTHRTQLCLAGNQTNHALCDHYIRKDKIFVNKTTCSHFVT